MFYIDNIETEKKYDEVKFLQFNNDNLDPLNSYMLSNIKSLPEQGNYIITNFEKRPDMISYRIYGDTQYWWVIMHYNDVDNINLLTNGTVIYYPSLNAIENLYINANTYKKTMGNS